MNEDNGNYSNSLFELDSIQGTEQEKEKNEREKQQKERLQKKKSARLSFQRNIALAVVCIILGVVITLVYKGIIAERQQEEIDTQKLTDYQARIIELGNEVDALTNTKNDLMDKLAVYESGTNEEKISALEKQNSALRKFACLTDVVGEGVTVTISFNNPSDVSSAGNLIQLLINELKASSAQAIAVNGERLTASSEVRAVSDYLVVNGSYYYAPYVISAIGSATALESSLDVSIKSKFEAFFKTCPGSINIAYSSNIKIPAFDEAQMESRSNMMFDAG